LRLLLKRSRKLNLSCQKKSLRELLEAGARDRHGRTGTATTTTRGARGPTQVAGVSAVQGEEYCLPG